VPLNLSQSPLDEVRGFNDGAAVDETPDGSGLGSATLAWTKVVAAADLDAQLSHVAVGVGLTLSR
jgi:hypothetical protein